MFDLFHEQEELKQARDLCRPLCLRQKTTRGSSAADWLAGHTRDQRRRRHRRAACMTIVSNERREAGGDVAAIKDRHYSLAAEERNQRKEAESDRN